MCLLPVSTESTLRTILQAVLTLHSITAPASQCSSSTAAGWQVANPTREDSNAVFRARKSQGAQACQNQGSGMNFQPKMFFSPFLRTDVPLVRPKHTCGRTRADSFQDITVLSGYNAMAALLGQVPPGSTCSLKNKAVFLKQHIMAPNPTGANRQECCNRKTLLDAEGTSLSVPLLPQKANSLFYGAHSCTQ